MDQRSAFFTFQSTLPVWGGTIPGLITCDCTSISIHPPRVGRDRRALRGWSFGFVFQSTLPVWGGTTQNGHAVFFFHIISIHPPRVGRDGRPPTSSAKKTDDFNPPSPCGEGPGDTLLLLPPCRYFNPPSPCGEGPMSVCLVTIVLIFQSTLPVWGGTAKAHKNSL